MGAESLIIELGMAGVFWMLAIALATRSRRETAAGWAAGAFAALAAILTLLVVDPSEESSWGSAVVAIQLAAVALVPLMFYRFAATLTSMSARWNAVADATTAALCLSAVVLALSGSEDGLRLYLLVLLGQWTWLSLVSLTALWKASKTAPRITRLRVRLLAAAIGLLNVALAAVVTFEQGGLSTIALELAGASAIGFFLAFSSPPWLRAIWRRPTQIRLDAAVQELITATDEEAIARQLLPHVIDVLGAERAALIGAEGSPVAVETAPLITQISDQAREINISSSLRVWVPAVTPMFARDELSLLGAVGTMADLAVERAHLLRAERDRAATLKGLTEELQATNSALKAEVKERHEAELEAQTSRTEAERANKAKSDFLSRMSHELRTPLNSILGFAQLLSSDELTEDQLDSVDHILKGGHHLLALINEVLDISRIESGKMAISPEPVDISGLIDEVVDMMRPAAAERQIDMTLVLDLEPMTYVHADRQRLKQILINLVSNAIKYNRVAGRVTISTRSRGDRAAVIVSDTGPGIAEPKLERLFVPFDRLDADPSDVEGTGLGLALSKGLAELMDGSLSASSVPGEGSNFAVELRIADAPLPEGTLTGEQTLGVDTEGTLTVLYIEDNLTNVRLVERILAAYPGIKLLTTMQARTGLEMARHHSPGLVLLDLHLPDLPGDTVLKQLRAEPATRSAKIVILSADATPGRIVRLKETGADDYLTKPLDVAHFRQVIEDTIGALA